MRDLKVLEDLFPKKNPIIGMVHLRSLPGAPLYDPVNMNMDRIISIAVEEAKKLENAGVDGLQIENIWDYPYLKGSEIGHETIATMSVIASKVKDSVSIPIGINCHLNGGMEAMAIACACNAKWIRVFEYVNAYVSRAGFLEAIGAKLSRYRTNLSAENVKLFCDVNVKHGSHFIISDRSITEQALDAQIDGAEALIVTGFETGQAPTPKKVKEFADNINVPVLIGSGVTKENVGELMEYSDGMIVGSYFKKNNNWKNDIDESQVKEFVVEVEKNR
ncbi:BtpA/SgcQ family protein [Vallitalea guaymasensis]|uniref:BtpA/SgcQ family protein n=1 Tax=Vallitalea guaymasensis TaxID=1185412 RepID=A0A8J8MCN7_9FIRM|nr:BtpA/SgcQ family protein [Vallitalea guaymasensis]QUH30527.1 BtpA/SgcQ family protein [Vallitalea guaymasensis]